MPIACLCVIESCIVFILNIVNLLTCKSKTQQIRMLSPHWTPLGPVCRYIFEEAHISYAVVYGIATVAACLDSKATSWALSLKLLWYYSLLKQSCVLSYMLNQFSNLLTMTILTCRRLVSIHFTMFKNSWSWWQCHCFCRYCPLRPPTICTCTIYLVVVEIFYWIMKTLTYRWC